MFRLRKRATAPPAQSKPRSLDDRVADYWETHRDRLLADAAPGTRPFLWWRFESPEVRRRAEYPIEYFQLRRMGVVDAREERRLRRECRAYDRELLQGHTDHVPFRRPWGYWCFERGITDLHFRPPVWHERWAWTRGMR